MQQIHFDPGFLAELDFYVPTTHKLVYLYILVFRGCNKDDIVTALNLTEPVVTQALSSLRKKKLIRIDRQKLIHLSDGAVKIDDVLLPPWGKERPVLEPG